MTVNTVDVNGTVVDTNTITGLDPGGIGVGGPYNVVVTNLDGTTVTFFGAVTIAP